MKRVCVVVALLAVLSVTSGCMSRAIKEGIGVATGAKGAVIVSQPVAARAGGYALAEFTQFKVEAFGDKSPSGVPAQCSTMLPVKVAEQLLNKKIPNQPGGKTLTIRGTYIYYESANMTMDQVFGPFEEVIARVQLVDGGNVLGEATCVGRSKESVNQGPEKKAEGLAKAIVDWIDKSYPPREDEE